MLIMVLLRDIPQAHAFEQIISWALNYIIIKYEGFLSKHLIYRFIYYLYIYMYMSVILYNLESFILIYKLFLLLYY